MRWYGVLALAAVAAGTACQKKNEGQDHAATTAATAAPAAQAGAPIVVGHVTSLTGDTATFGESSNNGVKLAIDEANAAGGVQGRKLALQVYDTAGKPEETATAATRAITEAKASVVIGELGSSRTLALAPIADTNKVPAITPASTNPKITKDGDKTRPYMFRVCFIDPFQGTVMAKFARQNLKVAKAAIVRDVGNDYSVGLADYFAKTFKELGGEIVVDVSYKSGDQDFKAQLTKVKFAKPDFVYVPGYYTDVALIGRQAHELGLKAQLAGGDGWDSSKLYEIAQGALDGGFFTNHYSADNPSPVVQGFAKKYEAAYHSKPDAFAALGYDAALLAIDAMKRASALTPDAIRDAIEKTSGLSGVTGTIRLDADHNPVKSAVIIGVEKNAPKYVTTVEP
ncbi:ABC transporter substrate-binding protein [Anaeromyxobacter paludicola]|uniref:Ethanolamine utilization protein EutJ n=1 Tax=Anaeromyxobacter paludicola TaxID=2918171 RepID=A0ABM7X506_9BACT|nr:ABC transporter substrate-binding protein [Anaeromyxobacter paludicola]BDG06896.1 ethanolamine utilization protein EutJ [Anaeromyxobacter paludicola]